MENNIFFRNKKNKFNPDIAPKLKEKEMERDTTVFKISNNIYNPITGIIPKQVNTVNDLIIEQDTTKVDILKRISEKENERMSQDNNFKVLKMKVVDNTQPINPTIPVNNYIETFEDLKNGALKKKNENYDNILDGLKDLGIIK